MICMNCTNAITGQTKGDIAMSLMKYRSCAAARTPEEKTRYVSGDTKCVYPPRFKAKFAEYLKGTV